MKREKLRELLGEAATDEVIDAIMAANGKDVNAANASAESMKAQLEAANAKVGELTEQANGKLSEEEKWQKALEKANAERDAAIRSLNEQSAIAVLAAAGLTEEDYKPFLGSIVTGDQATTTANAKSIADLVSAKVAAAREQAGKDDLAGMQPPAGGKPAGSVTTKDEFLALPYEQQLSLKQSNPDILNELK